MSHSSGDALKRILAAVEEKLGPGAAFVVGEAGTRPVPAISSGILPLDVALGVGGYPIGRVVEIYGPESSGKTTLALHAIASVQAQGGVAVFIDAEHAIDPYYAEALGVDLGAMLLAQPDSGEGALRTAHTAMKNGANIVVVDSVAALTPQSELDGEVGELKIGAQARMMSQAMRVLAQAASKSGCILLFTNQMRMKIGVMYGSPETTPGGNALKFYASVRLDIRRRELVKEGKTSVGNKARVRVVKNKVAPPFSVAEFEIEFGKGVCPASATISAGLAAGVLTRKGAYIYHDGVKLGQGSEKSKLALLEDPELLRTITAKVIEAC